MQDMRGRLLSCVLVVLGTVILAAPARAAVFSNPAQFRIPATGTSGVAGLYPSMIPVSGLTGAVTDVTVTLSGFSHTFPADVDVLLVGPSGQSVVLLADTGSGTDVNNATLTFSDAAPTPVPTPIVSGTYRPTNGGAFNGPAPAPPGPYGATLAAFNGTVPNGMWSLYVYDDFNADFGMMSGGWSLDITTNGPTISSFAPATGPAGTTVVITGTNLTGATSVAFGGTQAGSFTVNNPTTITATVPANVVSGPISVITPNGIASSTTPFQASPPPTIASFTPTRGRVGTNVTITGTNLAGASAASFGGTPVAAFSVTSPTTMTATVPAGAGGGTISVTAPGGTATSSSAFTVVHPRTVSLSFRHRRARGSLVTNDGYAKCAAGVRVTLKRRVHRRWRSVGRDLTNSSGTYQFSGRQRRGRYRVVANRAVLASNDICQRTRTRPVRA